MIEVGHRLGRRPHDVAVLDARGGCWASRRFGGRGGAGPAARRAGRTGGGPSPGPGRASRPTAACWSAALVAAGYQVYAVNPRRSTATVTAMARPAPSPMLVMPGCWLTWSAPIGTSTDGSRVTVSLPRRSRSWPGPSEPDLDPSAARQPAPQHAARLLPGRAGRPSAPTWPARMRWRCWPSPRPRRRGRGLTVEDPGGPLPRWPWRKLDRRAAEIHQALRAEQSGRPVLLADAYGARAWPRSGRVDQSLNAQIDELARHSASSLISTRTRRSCVVLPGLGSVLGARVLGEFGDDPNRYADAKAARTTRGPPRSPRPRGAAGPCWPGSRATGAWPTPACGGRSAR